MSNFLEDAFTGTDATVLSAHTPEVGGAWTVHNGNPHILGNKMCAENFAQGSAQNAATPPSADYQVACVIYEQTYGWGDEAGVLARGVMTGTDYITSGYSAGWYEGDMTWKLTKWSGGGATVLDSWEDLDFTAGSKSLVLTCLGDSLSVTIDGVLRCSATDTTFTGAGNVGVFASWGVEAAVALDTLVAGDISGEPPGTHTVSGRGNFVITELAWISIALAGIPDTASNGQAEPPNFYHVGMVSWGTDNGTMTAYPVTRELELIQIPAGMTILHYEFAPGIVATIVELSGP